MVIAIDGRCASGKTTIAEKLQKYYSCEVIHMDHFFLRPEQRTEKRLSIPGENVDYERFMEAIIKPMKAGMEFSYCPYLCQKGQLGEPIQISRAPIYIVEGAYSCHPSLWDCYDLHFFMTVDGAEQLRRIALRNGQEKLEIFKSKWIPLEELYFEYYGVEERCEGCYQSRQES